MDQIARSDIIYVIESFKLNDVRVKGRFNSCNHWIGDERPENYEETLNDTNTKYWIDLFRTHYKVLNINLNEFDWMIKTWNIGQLMNTNDLREKYKDATDELFIMIRSFHIRNSLGKILNLYKDEFNDLMTKYKNVDEELFKEKDGYFVRTENVSLKAGCHGVGPYSDFKSIIESILTASNGHSPINENITELPKKAKLSPVESPQ